MRLPTREAQHIGFRFSVERQDVLSPAVLTDPNVIVHPKSLHIIAITPQPSSAISRWISPYNGHSETEPPEYP